MKTKKQDFLIYSLFASLLLLIASSSFANKLTSIAFYYGAHPPTHELRAFNAVVVDPDQKINPQQLNTKNSETFAYVSIGEVSPKRRYFHQISDTWIIGKNTTWQSKVLDQSNPKWRAFFINQVITPLWGKGYRGFFLDTLDSFQIAAKTPKEKTKQIDGLIKLVKAIKEKYPKARLIYNRGFEILPQTHQLVYALTVESLFAGWNQQEKRYEPVKKSDREWLLKKLDQVKQYNIPAISIDYLPPQDRKKAKAVAKKIEKLGVIPWVTNADLSIIGVSSINMMPRKILTFYDGTIDPQPMFSPAVMFAAMPLEYLGYVPIAQDIRTFSPSNEKLTGRYAGILLWLNSNYLIHHPKLQNWLIKQKNAGIPIVLFGNLGKDLNKKFTTAFGLSIKEQDDTPQNIKITQQSPMMGYEIKPFPNRYTFFPITISKGRPLLTIEDSGHQKMDAAAIMPWGGYILHPFFISTLPNHQTRWVVNPIDFFKAAFKQQFPIPDSTTENGRRLLLVHVDGDGFVSRAEWKPAWLCGKAMLEKIFKHYQIPTTVSVIQGEIGPSGLYPKLAKEAMSDAKSIFQLPWIEAASHSFSHPFKWQPSRKTDKNMTPLAWHLKIPNYTFNLNKEITGSVEFINKKLMPKGKTCHVYFWTGDCNPTNTAVKLTYKDQLLNMNGGDTIITNDRKSLTNVAPLGMYKGKYFQVFSPSQNENIYTNLWRGPFYGYRRTIETFKLTNKPLRLKPISIYYHFYSASKLASLKALKEVYDWALQQPMLSIYTSEYIQKVLDYNNITIAQKNGGWLVLNDGHLRELRTEQTQGYPDLKNSHNVIGFKANKKEYYVHLGPRKKTFIRFTKLPPKTPYLVDANGIISYYQKEDEGFKFKIKSYQPTQLTLANMKRCRLYKGRKRISGKRENQNTMFTFKHRDEGKDEFTVRC